MSDYDNLINKAQKNLSAKEERQEQQKRERNNDGPKINPKIVAAILIIAVVAIDIYVFVPKISQEQIHKDIEVLIRDAEKAINDYATEFGVLPPQIPAPTLRSVISYQVIDAQSNPPEYILSSNYPGATFSINSLRDQP